MTDNVKLGRSFRDHYLRGLKRLLAAGKLELAGSVSFLNDAAARTEWFKELESIDWNVFIQGPPAGKSDPAQVVKYLAGYLTGGPIAERRLIRADDNEVHFWARPKRSDDKHKGMNRAQPYRLSGHEFIRRWTMHILPKGFIRSRSYGGYHSSKRAAYLAECRELLPPVDQQADAEPQLEPSEAAVKKCPHCEGDLSLIHSERRPSWRTIFTKSIYRSSQYSPMHHIGTGRSPPQ